jgi:hypothetical protein
LSASYSTAYSRWAFMNLLNAEGTDVEAPDPTRFPALNA